MIDFLLSFSLNPLPPPRPTPFPTRRSSDLLPGSVEDGALARTGRQEDHQVASLGAQPQGLAGGQAHRRDLAVGRSEEHTSELQSHSDLVCRLLLEKKKKKKIYIIIIDQTHS